LKTVRDPRRSGDRRKEEAPVISRSSGIVVATFCSLLAVATPASAEDAWTM
jgi:hypothetical protein